LRPRHHTKKAPWVRGLDTEARKGNLLVVCSPTRHHEYRGGKDGPQRLLDWLWRISATTNFFYNLTYDRDVLLKPLASRMKKGAHSVRCGPFLVKLLGNKSFRIIREGSHESKAYYDISGFFAGEEGTFPLETTARLFLGEGKLPDVDRVRLGSEIGYYEARRAEVIRYCKRDAALAEKLGKLLVRTLYDSLGFYPSRFNSKASISKAWLEVYHPELFQRKRFPKWSLARSSYRGGIFLTRILGRVEQVAEADISSAYGDALRKLPRLDRLRRLISNTYHPEAKLGAYWVLVDYDGRTPLDPSLRNKRRGRARIVYPDSHGALKPYTASKAEMDYFSESKRSFVVLMAEEFFGEYEPQFPEMEGLLQKVAALKGPAKTDPKAAVERMLFKTIVNAAYGCLAESKHGETMLTCWPLAAEITGRTRVKIWREWDHLSTHRAEVVSINTDSLRVMLPLDFAPCAACTLVGGVGEFEPKFADSVVTHFQSGIAIIEEEGRGPKLRKRGKPLLTVDLLKKARGPVLSVPSHGVTHLYEALAQDRTEDIGVFDDPNNPADDTKIDLRSNLFALDFDESLLRFEVLNARPVIGFAPDFDSVTQGVFERRARRSALRATVQSGEAPESVRPLSERAQRRTESPARALGPLGTQVAA
jgi:hypothetical protein